MKEETKILKKILVCVYILIALVVMNTVILVIVNGNNKTKEPTNNSDYDVSAFEKASVKDVLAYFEDGSTKVVYMGKATCSYCQLYVPYLTQAQKDYKFKTVYLDTTTITESSSEYKDLIKKLNLDYVMDPGDGEGERTKKFGAWYDEYGYTPCTFIIKKGKMVAGEIGYMQADALATFLEANGFSK